MEILIELARADERLQRDTLQVLPLVAPGRGGGGGVTAREAGAQGWPASGPFRRGP